MLKLIVHGIEVIIIATIIPPSIESKLDNFILI